jgi:hypothetical protein
MSTSIPITDKRSESKKKQKSELKAIVFNEYQDTTNTRTETE